MIEELLRVVRARGVDRMWVLTNASNEPAMRLYASLGAGRMNPDDAMWEWPLC
jgi:ribosomal protein S18 acetylase RimI-like enzyme